MKIAAAGVNQKQAERMTLAKVVADYGTRRQFLNLKTSSRESQLVMDEFMNVTHLTFTDEVTWKSIFIFQRALRARGLNDSTVCRKLSQLRSLLRFAGVNNQIFPPLPRYEKKVPTAYTSAQIREIFAAADPYETIAFQMALKLGLREQELMYAEFPDISFDGKVFRVRGTAGYGFRISGNGQREIPIADDLLAHLREWTELHPRQTMILPAPDGNPNRHLPRRLERLVNRAGLACGACESCLKHKKCSEYTLRKFRRTFIVRLLAAGVDIRTLMFYAGHSNAQTTMRLYMPVLAKDGQAVINAIDWDWADLT